MGKYPVEVAVIEQRSGTLKVKKGKAARITKKGGFTYYSIKMGLSKPIKTKPLKYEHLYVKDKGYFTLLYSPSPDQYIPLEFDCDGAKVKAIDEDLRMFLIDSILDSQNRFKPMSFFHKYFPIISIVFTAIAFAVILFAAADMLQTAGGTVSQAASILNSVQIGQVIGG